MAIRITYVHTDKRPRVWHATTEIAAVRGTEVSCRTLCGVTGPMTQTGSEPPAHLHGCGECYRAVVAIDPPVCPTCMRP